VRHVTHIADLGPEGVRAVLDQAVQNKLVNPGQHLKDALLGMVFFNPSLRTRTSFEAAMIRGGGHAVVLEVGGGVWKLEDREGVVMNADKTEHLKEAVPVLARYVDMLAVRTFAQGIDEEADNSDPVINGFRKYSTCPVVSMESAREHPCQGLADMLTVRETFGQTAGVPVTLSWAPHMKPLPKAVPNSFLLTAAASGCKVRVAHPKGFELHPSVIAEAETYAAQSGGRIEYTNDQPEALDGSRVLYAKAWGPTDKNQSLEIDGWMPTEKHFEKMASDAIFMHCLPVRRNLEVSDEVLDGPHCKVVDEAENRFHVQRVLLDLLYKSIRGDQ
jgi:N-acetylornithine carbamoyltransferase